MQRRAGYSLSLFRDSCAGNFLVVVFLVRRRIWGTPKADSESLQTNLIPHQQHQGTYNFSLISLLAPPPRLLHATDRASWLQIIVQVSSMAIRHPTTFLQRAPWSAASSSSYSCFPHHMIDLTHPCAPAKRARPCTNNGIESLIPSDLPLTLTERLNFAAALFDL